MLNPADAAFVASLADRLPQDMLRAPDARHLTEPRGRGQARAGVVATPRTVDEVAMVVRACAEARVGLVPWGGGTGLVRGQGLSNGAPPVLLSLERMAALRSLHPDEDVIVVEAGMILADVQARAAAVGRLFPLSLASEGTATIGGNLAANAGGTGVIRYGNARDLALGLEVVMADGTVWHGLKRLRKDNAGYDLRHLMIGSEGTLGIITAASLRLFPQPGSVATALLVVTDPDAALRLLTLAADRAGGMISAFELISGVGLRFLAETMPEVTVPLPGILEWSVLIEIGLPPGMDAAAMVEAIYAAGSEAGLVGDGVIATTEAQRAGLWRIRESLPQANRRIGAVSSHDVSVPLGAVGAFIAAAAPALARIGGWRINCFGHLGDGNLHYNVFPLPGCTRADHEHQRDAIKRCVHDLVHSLGGSVAAEHGVGRLKVADLERYADPAKLAAMRAIKAALDPLGILNPGAVLRQV